MFRNAGPSTAKAFSALVVRSFQWLIDACAAYGMLCAAMIEVRSFAALRLALLRLADLGGRRPGAERRGAGPLDAGVHVGAVVVADVDHVVAALHGTGQRLQADVVRAAVAAERDELHALVGGDLAGALQALERRLDAGDRRRRVLERVVDERGLPRRVRIDRGRDLEAAGRAAHHERRLARAEQDLAHRDRRAAAGAQAVSARERSSRWESSLMFAMVAPPYRAPR